MKKMKSGLFSYLILVIMFAFLTVTAYSQSDSTTNHGMNKQKMTTQHPKYDKEVIDAAAKLGTQIDLTTEQTLKVEGILQNYINSNSSENNKNNNMSSSDNSTMSSPLSKIENVLTSDQKSKFDQIKDQWWSETQQSLSKSSTTDKSKSGY